MGGVGLTDLQDYLWAARLDQLKHWFQGHNRPIWADIEEKQIPTKSLTTFLMGDNWTPWNITQLSPPIRVSIQAWRYPLSLQHIKVVDIEVQHPLDILEAQIPKLSTKPLLQQGITQISDLYEEQQPKSAEQILHDYKLPKKTSIYLYTHITLFESQSYHKNQDTCQSLGILYHYPQ